MAASAHFFSACSLKFSAALNGPQYIVERGTTEENLRAVRDVLCVAGGPGLGVNLGAALRDALPA